MIGMNFSAFLVLAVTGTLAAAVIHYVARYRFLEGFDGFLGKAIAGWVGGWLGSPILGHWFERVTIANIYLIPALLGAFVGGFVVAGTGKALAKALGPAKVSGAEVQEMKKAA
jgi:uncharacterized membrane protein YeaQ/YmgE (transglycosylase-associated protein family)